MTAIPSTPPSSPTPTGHSVALATLLSVPSASPRGHDPSHAPVSPEPPLALDADAPTRFHNPAIEPLLALPPPQSNRRTCRKQQQPTRANTLLPAWGRRPPRDGGPHPASSGPSVPVYSLGGAVPGALPPVQVVPISLPSHPSRTCRKHGTPSHLSSLQRPHWVGRWIGCPPHLVVRRTESVMADLGLRFFRLETEVLPF